MHPLYVSLQKSSPLNMLLKEPYDVKDHEYDQQKRPLDGKKFYRKYMSKSLPCVFRNEVVKNDFFLDLKAASSREDIDKVLENNHKTTFGPIKTNGLVLVSKIQREFSKQG